VARTTLPAGTVYFVRHGLVHNPDRIAYGWLPRFRLADEGRAQAQATAAYLADSGAKLILTSPLLRAVQTTRIIAAQLPGVPVRRSRLLIESGLAHVWEGLAWEAIPKQHPEVWRTWQQQASACELGESLTEQAERMRRAFALALRRSNGGPAICVSHRDPILALRLSIEGRSHDDVHSTDTQPASVTIVRSDGRQLYLDGYVEPYHAVINAAAGN
jgi:broad specificity phosphatase PhoE